MMGRMDDGGHHLRDTQTQTDRQTHEHFLVDTSWFAAAVSQYSTLATKWDPILELMLRIWEINSHLVEFPFSIILLETKSDSHFHQIKDSLTSAESYYFSKTAFVKGEILFS